MHAASRLGTPSLTSLAKDGGLEEGEREEAQLPSSANFLKYESIE